MCDLVSLQDEAMKILDKEPNKKLRTLKSLRDQSDDLLLDYVYSLIKNLKVFVELFKTVHESDASMKSNVASKANLKTGNEILNGGEYKFENVLKSFTSAVVHAADNEQLSEAYAARSRLFLEERCYNECVRDIERALNSEPSNDLRQTLQARRQQTEELEFWNAFNFHAEVPSPPGPANGRIQGASRAIGFVPNKIEGQRIVAMKDISIGEVLVVEEPYAVAIHPNTPPTHVLCHGCLEQCFDVIPCPKCTIVIYCSDVCRVKAFLEYHKYECILFQRKLCKKQYLFLKAAFKAATSYKSYREDMSKDNGATFRSNHYKYVSSLKTFKEYMSPKMLFQFIVEPAAFYHFLIKYTTILKDLQESGCPDGKTFLKEVLVKNILLQAIYRTHIKSSQRTTDMTLSFRCVGHAMYPFHSNFRHSCFHNAEMVFYGSKVVLHAIRNIKKGELITVNYGAVFTDTPKDERTTKLNELLYTCECIACSQNWPLCRYLKQGPQIPRAFLCKIREFLEPNRYLNRTRGKKYLEEMYFIYNQREIPTNIPDGNYWFLTLLVTRMLHLMGNVSEP